MPDEMTHTEWKALTPAQRLPGPWTDEAVDDYLRPLEHDARAIQRHIEDGDLDEGDQLELVEQEWGFVGSYLRCGREAARLSKRAAARRAGISEGLWRHLEAGQKMVQGVTVFPNPRSENLHAAALAVGVDPRPIFRAIGRSAGPIPDFEPADKSLQARIDRLNHRDRQLVEQLVDSMIEHP